MEILNGKRIAQAILDEIATEIKKSEIKPGLAVILAGKNKASEIYVSLKGKRAKEVGIDFQLKRFPSDVSEDKVINEIENLNSNRSVNGIIVQLPLPDSFDTQRIIDEIDPKKDVDGFHPENLNLFNNGKEIFWPVFPKAIVKLIESAGIGLGDKKAVVLANSERFGKEMEVALKRFGLSSNYILSDEIEENKNEIKQADILVTALGNPALIKGEMIKEGAILIDGGITKIGEKVRGDIDFESVKNKASFLSPVPGGVGPVTIACLLENVYLASLFKR